MNIRNYVKQKWVTIIATLMSAVVVWACSKSPAEESAQPSGDSAPVVLSVSAADAQTDAESAIRTLRLFVFSDEDGEMLFSKLYRTESADTEIPEGTYTYFVFENGRYKISEMLPKQTLRIYVIANEANSLDNINITEEQIRGWQLNYYNLYGSGGTMDITITGTGSDSNIGYVPMFAQSGTLTPHQWNASGGKVVDMELIRTLAKVSVRLKAGAMTGGDFILGDKLTIKSASIVRVPQYVFVGDATISNSGTLVSTATQSFATPAEIDGNNEVTTDKLSFYIPEHIISQAYVANKQYTYIQVNADYYSVNTGKTIRSTYKIPLGNGVSKLYDANPVNIGDLTVADLTVSRNIHYNVEAKVTTIGTLEGLQVAITVLDWDGEESVSGDADSPLLNVSSLNVNMIGTKARVSFWTNRNDIYVENTGQKNGAANYTVNDIFNALSGAKGVSTANFHLYAEGDNKYYPYNGYIDFEFNDPAANLGASDTYSVVLNAGGLKRTITLKANPDVAKVIFNANGGSGTYVYNVRVSDINGAAVLDGAFVSIANPKALFTPPAGMSYQAWTYYATGAPIVDGSDTDAISVRLDGDITNLYVWWVTI